MTALFILIDQIISLYVYTLFAYVIISWLVALRILNPWQPFVRMATNFFGRIHEPLLGRVRRFMPDLGGIDISPVILLLGAEFLRNLIGGLAK
jgi:YggT family protein